MPKESIQKIQPYRNLEESRIGALRLDFNENLLGASPKVIEALRKVSRETCGCYPEYLELKKELSRFLEISEDCLIPTNGSDEAIKTIFDTYVDKGDEVILLSPSFSMYELYAQVVGAKIIWIPYRMNDFSFPLEEILKAIQPNTRLIVLANPNNPTGSLIVRDDLLKIVKANPKMAVVIDEAYGPYARVSNIDLALKYSNVFILQTFSKAHGLAGLRIGYMISVKENIQVIAKILSPSYSVDCLAAVAAIAAMEDKAYVSSYVDEIIALREQFSKEVSSLGFQVIPSQANFVLVRFGKWAEKVKEEFKQQKILVRERTDLKGFLRITIGTKEQMQKVMTVLRSFFLSPMNVPKIALLFDMDGVLIDENQSYRVCIIKTAEHFLGKKIDSSLVEALKQKKGYNNDYDCTEAILSQWGLEVKREEIKERFDFYYYDLKKHERWLVDVGLLLRLKKKFRLGIFTGRPKKDALDALKRFGTKSLFEVVISDEDVLHRKPDPEGLILAKKILKVEKMIFFGDSRDDREAAKRASVEYIEIEPPGKRIVEILEGFL